MRKHFLLFLALAATVLASASLLACGSSGDDGQVIEVVAQDMRFSPEVIEVPAGQEVTLKLKNLDANEHDLEVRGLTASIQNGGGHGGHGTSTTSVVAAHAPGKKTATVKFRADQPGTYEVVCTVMGHAESGMVAQLVVI